MIRKFRFVFVFLVLLFRFCLSGVLLNLVLGK